MNEGQTRLNLRPIGPDSVIEELAKRVVLSEHIPLRKQTISIKRVIVDTDPRACLFSVEITDEAGTGVWSETLQSVEQVRFFLKGIKVATVMAGGTFLAEECVWTFTEDSDVESFDDSLVRLDRLF